MHKTILFDQLTPVALYGKIKTLFPDEITMLFESVVNTADGNFSFITIGAQERLSYKDKMTRYTDQGGTVRNLSENPFSFLKSYYASLDQAAYQAKAQEVGFSFVDGFIGFIGYDMVKVFEPVLEKSMDDLYDPLNTPDLDLVRPSIIIAYSHKNAKLTLILNDTRLNSEFNEIEKSLGDICIPMPLQPVELEGEGEFSIGEERFNGR
jgi:anthranilate synthase component 1